MIAYCTVFFGFEIKKKRLIKREKSRVPSPWVLMRVKMPVRKIKLADSKTQGVFGILFIPHYLFTGWFNSTG